MASKHVIIDNKLKKALIEYSILENATNHKEKVRITIKNLLSENQTILYSKFLTAAKVAVKLDNINDIKDLLHEDFNT